MTPIETGDFKVALKAESPESTARYGEQINKGETLKAGIQKTAEIDIAVYEYASYVDPSIDCSRNITEAIQQFNQSHHLADLVIISKRLHVMFDSSNSANAELKRTCVPHRSVQARSPRPDFTEQ